MKPFTWILGITLLLSACSLFDRNRDRPVPEPEPELPPITNEGANTFGCRIDGEVWVPESNHLLRPRLSGTFGLKTFRLVARQIDTDDTVEEGVSIYLEQVVEPDTFWLSQIDTFICCNFPKPPENLAGYYRYNGSEAFEYGTSNPPYAGYVVITSMDTLTRNERRHIAGVFSFTAKDTASGRIVEVREGRFDVRLNY
jgi:hypothetical protein